MVPAIAPEERAGIDVVLSTASSPGTIDFEAFGTALLNAQRQIPTGQEIDGAARFRVSGYVLQTQVSRIGIQQEVIHTWNDALGKRIIPTCF